MLRRNRWKLFLVPVLYFVLSYGFCSFFIEDERKENIITPSLAISGCLSLVSLLYAMSSYSAIEKLLKDTSERSLMPLFDEGYTLVPEDKKNPLMLTTENLKAKIAGIPLTVSFIAGGDEGRYPPSIKFVFYPLYHPKYSYEQEKTLSFDLDSSSNLTRDIKPDIQRFVEELKASGYTAFE